MGNEKLNKLLIGFIILVACFALDRFSKIYILNILIFSILSETFKELSLDTVKTFLKDSKKSNFSI